MFQANFGCDVKKLTISALKSPVLQFCPMFLKFRLFSKNFEVTLWVKELQNVAQSISVVSSFHMDCIKPKIFALRLILEKLVQ